MRCKLCGKDNFICIHNGTRDVHQLRVMKCISCNMVQLDNFSYNTEQNYEGGGYVKSKL